MFVLFFFVSLEKYAYFSQVVQKSPVDIEVCFDFSFRFQLISNWSRVAWSRRPVNNHLMSAMVEISKIQVL